MATTRYNYQLGVTFPMERRALEHLMSKIEWPNVIFFVEPIDSPLYKCEECPSGAAHRIISMRRYPRATNGDESVYCSDCLYFVILLRMLRFKKSL